MNELTTRFLPGIMLLTLLSVPASASDITVFDGSWWQGLSRTEQSFAVQGMLAGYQSGYWRGLNDAITAVVLRSSSLSGSQLVGVTKLIASSHLKPLNATFGTVIDRLNDLYVEHPEVARDATAYYIACAASESGDCSGAIKAVHH